MARPTFRRFWIKILPDGRALPQFDPNTGKSHEAGDYSGPLAQLVFYPVTANLAQKIKSNQDQAEKSNLPVLIFEFDPGDDVKFFRVGTLRKDDVTICGLCGAILDWGTHECPRCLARVQWYCSKCDTLKTPIIDTIVISEEGDVKSIKIVPALQSKAWKIVEQLPGLWRFKDIQARCPDCEKTDPRGLKFVECLFQGCAEVLYTHYVLEVNGKKTLILDYKRTRPDALR